MSHRNTGVPLLVALAACAGIAIGGLSLTHHIQVPLRDLPLHVSGTWWSPTALRYGIRSLHGRVVNTTDSVWSNVQVSVRFVDAHGESLYVRTVSLGSIEPRAAAEFATGSLPGAPRGYQVFGLSGTVVFEDRKLVARPRGRPDPQAPTRGGFR